MRIRFSTLVFCLLFLGAVVWGDVLVGRDGDLFTHIRYGEHVLAHGFNAPDSTVFTTSSPPVLHAWLAEVLLALLTNAFGLGVPLVLAACVWGGIPALVFASNTRRFGFWPGLLAASMALVGLGSSFTLRPHLVSWVLFLLALGLLPDRRKTWPWLLLLAVAWANLHGGASVLLPLLAVAYAAGDLLEHRRPSWGNFGLVIAILAVMNLNPEGPSLWRHLWDFLRLGDLNRAQDMKPPDLVTGTAVTYAVLTAFMVAGLHKASWSGRFVMVGVWLMSWTAMRHLPFLGMAVALFATSGVADRLGFLAESSRRLANEFELEVRHGRRLAGLVVAAATVWRLLVPPEPAGPSVPAAAMAWFRRHPTEAQEHGYAGFNYAGYLFHDTPIERQYLHGLNASIPLSLMVDLDVLMRGGEPAMDLLKRHAVRWVVVHRGEPLALTLADAGWIEKLGASDNAQLFTAVE